MLSIYASEVAGANQSNQCKLIKPRKRALFTMSRRPEPRTSNTFLIPVTHSTKSQWTKYVNLGACNSRIGKFTMADPVTVLGAITRTL
jgi:hypothetical protein